MSQQLGAASAPFMPGICEEKARLECRYRRAEDAFDVARTAVRRRVGRSSKDEYLTLDRVADLAWDCLQHAMRELASHVREHGCGVIQGAPPTLKPIW